MPKMRDHQAVDAAYARTGPNATVVRQSIPRSADKMWAALQTAEGWTPIDIVASWTSDEPHGIGSTRRATGKAGLTIDEHVLIWREGRSMGWRFDRSTLPVAAFCEEFELNPTGNDFCEMVWYFALETPGPLNAATGKVFAAGFKLNAQKALARMAVWAEENLPETRVEP